jgi:Fe-S-cluster containining protein
MADGDRKDEGNDPELARGLMYVHDQLGRGLLKHDELAAHVHALTESLIASGALVLRDFEKRKEKTKQMMLEEALTKWEGAEILNDDTDKYSVEPVKINCAERLHLCKAACCRLDFHLSRQDLHEGVVKWDVGRPYHIRRRADGWCHHSEKSTKRCRIHEERPLTCRQYDCRNDARIWEDFEQAIPSPTLATLR